MSKMIYNLPTKQNIKIIIEHLEKDLKDQMALFQIQSRKFFNKKAKQLIDNNVPIEELIKMYQQRYRKIGLLSLVIYTLKQSKDTKGNYFKDYSYSNPHQIQWDSKNKKKYSFCLKLT